MILRTSNSQTLRTNTQETLNKDIAYVAGISDVWYEDIWYEDVWYDKTQTKKEITLHGNI